METFSWPLRLAQGELTVTAARKGFDIPLFAYGSSLCVDQMEERNVRWDAKRLENAALENYRLSFRGRSERREYQGGGLADLDAEPGSKVLGVVYWTDGDLEDLDRAEGVFAPHPRGCCRIQVAVRVGTRAIPAQTYVRKHKDPPNPPHELYLRKIIEGARHLGFSEDWIHEILDAARGATPRA